MQTFLSILPTNLMDVSHTNGLKDMLNIFKQDLTLRLSEWKTSLHLSWTDNAWSYHKAMNLAPKLIWMVVIFFFMATYPLLFQLCTWEVADFSQLPGFDLTPEAAANLSTNKKPLELRIGMCFLFFFSLYPCHGCRFARGMAQVCAFDRLENWN